MITYDPVTGTEHDTVGVGAEQSPPLGRDESGLTPQLVGLEGYRVEVRHKGKRRRFIVGRTRGWTPHHVELARRDSEHGRPAAREYESIRVLYDAREVTEWF